MEIRFELEQNEAKKIEDAAKKAGETINNFCHTASIHRAKKELIESESQE